MIKKMLNHYNSFLAKDLVISFSFHKFAIKK